MDTAVEDPSSHNYIFKIFQERTSFSVGAYGPGSNSIEQKVCRNHMTTRSDFQRMRLEIWSRIAALAFFRQNRYYAKMDLERRYGLFRISFILKHLVASCMGGAWVANSCFAGILFEGKCVRFSVSLRRNHWRQRMTLLLAYLWTALASRFNLTVLGLGSIDRERQRQRQMFSRPWGWF